MAKADCIFCQIVAGTGAAHVIWEDERHIAFLSIFPNTKGFTIVATKEHYDSYAFEQSDEVLAKLIVATKRTAQILDAYFDDVARCGMFFEGFGVDHLHSKLFPMHGTGHVKEDWSMIESETMDRYFEKYPGYLISNSSHRADDAELTKLAADIRQHAQKQKFD